MTDRDPPQPNKPSPPSPGPALEDEVATLRTRLAGHGLSSSHVEAFAAHFRLLRRWNPTHNLTRVVAAEDAAVLHYLDCALPLLELPEPAPGRLLDIGSGAGFPGLIAAAVWPSTEVVLVEPARKRASFLQVAAGELGLKNVRLSTPSAARGAGDQAALVLTRATFSAGARAELWDYVGAGGVLWAWTTHHNRATWETEAATWSPTGITWHPYVLPALHGGEPASHGVLRVHRGPL